MSFASCLGFASATGAHRFLVYRHVADVLKLRAGVPACMRCNSSFMGHTSKQASARPMACYWFSQDPLQLRAEHKGHERQWLNQPNLNIFSKILAAKNTLPPTRSSHRLQTIITFFFLMHMAIPGLLHYIDPKILRSSEV